MDGGGTGRGKLVWAEGRGQAEVGGEVGRERGLGWGPLSCAPEAGPGWEEHPSSTVGVRGRRGQLRRGIYETLKVSDFIQGQRSVI